MSGFWIGVIVGAIGGQLAVVGIAKLRALISKA